MAKILLVEDDETQAKVAKMFLEQGNHKVIVVETVKQALKKLEKEIPNLILLDVIMPGDYGLTLLKKMKEEGKWKKIPVIVLTIVCPTSGIKDDIKEIDKKAGFLEKPYTKEQLLTLIKKIIK